MDDRDPAFLVLEAMGTSTPQGTSRDACSAASGTPLQAVPGVENEKESVVNDVNLAASKGSNSSVAAAALLTPMTRAHAGIGPRLSL